MGWADLVGLTRFPYDSEQAIKPRRRMMGFISREAMQASVELAKQRGPFPRWFQESIYQKGERQQAGSLRSQARRNATVTTVAPTGTISLIANCSSGIEPIYSIAYRRLSFESERLMFVHPLFEDYARRHGFNSDAFDEAHCEQRLTPRFA